jgi:hypothetical protein
MRLILDTNILLSAILSSLGAPVRLPRHLACLAWERKKFTLVACDALMTERRDVAAGRFSGRDSAPARTSCSPRLQDFSFFCRDLPSGRGDTSRRSIWFTILEMWRGLYVRHRPIPRTNWTHPYTAPYNR